MESKANEQAIHHLKECSAFKKHWPDTHPTMGLFAPVRPIVQSDRRWVDGFIT